MYRVRGCSDAHTRRSFTNKQNAFFFHKESSPRLPKSRVSENRRCVEHRGLCVRACSHSLLVSGVHQLLLQEAGPVLHPSRARRRRHARSPVRCRVSCRCLSFSMPPIPPHARDQPMGAHNTLPLTATRSLFFYQPGRYCPGACCCCAAAAAPSSDTSIACACALSASSAASAALSAL